MGWDILPYQKSCRDYLDIHLGNPRIESPVRKTPDNILLSFVPHEVPEYTPFRPYSPFAYSNFQPSRNIAYSHWGVGEKGPASRSLANWAGTYREASTVDPLKAVDYSNVGAAIGIGIPILNYGRKAFMEAAGDPLASRLLAGAAGAASRYPILGVSYGLGNAIGSYMGYKQGTESRGDVLRSLPLLTKELISYPLSKYVGRESLRSGLVRGIGRGVLTRGAEAYSWIGNKLGSSWFTNKATEFSTSAATIEKVGTRYIAGDLEAVLGKELVQKLTPIFQEIADPVIDIAAFAISKYALNLGARYIDRRYPSSRYAYKHSGPGEKGPASRKITRDLGTYNTYSTVNAIKSTFLAEMKLLESTARGKTSQKIESIMKKVLDKYAVSKDEVSRWVRNNNLTKKLRRRGINVYQVSKELSSINEKPAFVSTEERVFLTKREKLQSHLSETTANLSGKEISNKIAFDNMSPKVPKSYSKKVPTETKTPSPESVLREEPSMDMKYVQEEILPSRQDEVRSNVNVRVMDAEVDMGRLDRTLARKLKDR